MTLRSSLNRLGRRAGKREPGQSESSRRQVNGPRIGHPGHRDTLTVAVDGVISDALRGTRGSTPWTVF